MAQFNSAAYGFKEVNVGDGTYTIVNSSINNSSFPIVYNCTGSTTTTITLSSAIVVTQGVFFIVKNSGNGIVTIQTINGQTIDGTTGQTLTHLNGIQVMSDGSNWFTIHSGTSGTNGSSGSSGSNGTNGSSGTSGSNGTNGSSGSNGTNGSSGSSGSNGTDGSSGTSGSNGTNGSSGSSGSNGTDGSSGSSGSNGTNGSSGSSGSNGTNGSSGSSGSNGTNGTDGSSGSNGTNGTSGSNGTNGTSGSNGTNGSSGSSGSNGSSGTSGSNGTDGSSGSNGSSGTSGSNGTDGSSGTSGSNGTDGSSGTSFIWKGNWASGTVYVKNDTVSYTGSSYTCITGHTSTTGITPTNGLYWNLMAQAGTSGSSGLSGSNGTNGTSGDSIFAQTGSFWNATKNVQITGSLHVIGNLTAQQYIVSSSVYYVTESTLSGSNIFGNTLDDYHYFTGSVGVTGSLVVSGSVNAAAYYEISDVNYKDIISTNPQIDLSTLDVIQFTLKGDNQVRYGYSAQDVQKLCSDLVVGDNPLTVNYNDVHTLKIHQLENKIKQLENKIESLYVIIMDRDNQK